jgi:sirohydrochlorin cobaltochelatase
MKPINQAVLVIAHGSRDAAARAEYLRVAGELAARLPDVPVEFAVLEFPGEDLNSIPDGVRRCAEAGAERVVALPFFLFAAGHVREDLPGELAQAAESVPGLNIAYQPPLGVEGRLLDVLESRAAEAEARLDGESDQPTALLIVGAGTSDPDSNADLYRAARLLWERKRYPFVEVAFVSLTAPRVDEAIRRCRALGAGRIVVVPYFLNTGVLSRRIAARLETSRQEDPGLEIVLGGEMGLHPGLLDLLAERARLGLESSVEAGLDLPPCAVSSRSWACWFDERSRRLG